MDKLWIAAVTHFQGSIHFKTLFCANQRLFPNVMKKDAALTYIKSQQSHPRFRVKYFSFGPTKANSYFFCKPKETH